MGRFRCQREWHNKSIECISAFRRLKCGQYPNFSTDYWPPKPLFPHVSGATDEFTDGAVPIMRRQTAGRTNCASCGALRHARSPFAAISLIGKSRTFTLDIYFGKLGEKPEKQRPFWNLDPQQSVRRLSVALPIGHWRHSELVPAPERTRAQLRES